MSAGKMINYGQQLSPAIDVQLLIQNGHHVVIHDGVSYPAVLTELTTNADTDGQQNVTLELRLFPTGQLPIDDQVKRPKKKGVKKYSKQEQKRREEARVAAENKTIAGILSGHTTSSSIYDRLKKGAS